MPLRHGKGGDAWVAYSKCGWIKKIEQREKNVLGTSREGSFRVKQHLAGFIGSADGIVVSNEPAVLDNSQVFGGGNVMGREGVNDPMWGVTDGEVLALGGVEV